MSEYRGFEVWRNAQGVWFGRDNNDLKSTDKVHGAHYSGGKSEADIRTKIDSYLARPARGHGVRQPR